MKTYLLPKDGQFYKANLHMHTTVSDGRMTPAEVKEEYMKRGYSIVAFTDHEALVPHNDLTDDKFLAITSYEIATNKGVTPGGFPFEQTYHINLYAKDPNKNISPVFTMSRLWPAHAGNYMSDEAKAVEWPREYTVESINALIARAKEDGFLVSYNHPNWSLQNYSDYAGLKGVWGVEYYNTGCMRAGYPDTMQPIDDLLAQGERVFPLATDDAHAGKATLHDCFGGFVMIKAEALEYGKIMTALEKGDFYASSGPTIEELYLEDGVLHLKTSAAAKVEVITERRNRWCRRGEGMTEFTFDLNGYIKTSHEVKEKRIASYFRITVTDASGETAQTRAFFEEEW
jgi:hypothetical protein